MSLYNNNTNPLPRRRTTEEYVKYLGIGSLPQCEKNERLLDLQDKIVEPNTGNFIPELSPDYNPSTGRLESDSHKPVRMISNDSANAGIIATKWIIRD
jgi:hypothetical protein